jgi:hypothetical protein
LESGQVALVGKGSVVEVRCALPVAEALPGTTAHRLEVVLSTGATLRGTTFWSAPPAHVRVIDVLNGSRFLRVDTDAGSVYVNTTHIRVAHPMD